MSALSSVSARLAAGRAVVAGVLSGTSGDGIDVALLRPAPSERSSSASPGSVPRPVVLAFETRPFASGMADRVRAALDGAPLDARAVALLDRDLGRAFGAAARAVADDASLPLDLVGSHGQTVWHHDGVEPSGPATLQLGDGAEVALAARACTVSDFRRADIAAGGEGAPLTPLVDAELFPEEPRPLVVLNLGGIANLTVVGADGALVATDAGPAGALLDGLSRRLFDRPVDLGGERAAAGTAVPARVEAWSRHPFFAKPAPKSTGRDTFGEEWIDGLLADPLLADPCDGQRDGRHDCTPEDLLATAVEVVARGVGSGLEHLATLRGARGGDEGAPTRILVAGGGVHHAPLLAAIALHTGLPAVSSAGAGIDPDAREAVAFGLLAARAVLGRSSTHPGATGARPGAVLGKISPFATPKR